MLSVRPSVRLSGVTLRQGDRLGKATSIVITRIFSEVRYLKSLFARRRSAIWCKGNTLTFGVEGSVGPTSRYPEFMFLNKLSGKKTINSYAKTHREVRIPDGFDADRDPHNISYSRTYYESLTRSYSDITFIVM